MFFWRFLLILLVVGRCWSLAQFPIFWTPYSTWDLDNCNFCKNDSFDFHIWQATMIWVIVMRMGDIHNSCKYNFPCLLKVSCANLKMSVDSYISISRKSDCRTLWSRQIFPRFQTFRAPHHRVNYATRAQITSIVMEFTTKESGQLFFNFSASWTIVTRSVYFQLMSR